jgi:Amt family ammonium transporter
MSGIDYAAKIAEILARMDEMQAELDGYRRLGADDAAFDAVTANFTAHAALIGGVNTAMTHMWLIICATLVIFMQAGFAMLEAGCCREGFVSSVLEKNLLDACIAALSWFMFGWGVAYGEVPQYGFIGTEQFATVGFLEIDADTGVISDPGSSNVNWFFQMAFTATSTTIISGAMAERLYLSGYIVFCFLMCSFIYPVVVAWTWSCRGWLNYVGAGYMDFAGSGIVHMCGGVGGLIGTVIMGPRKGRYEEGVDQSQFEPHNVPFIVLGTIILWVGWYGFNCGSTLSMNEGSGYLAAQVAVNTTLSPATAGLVVTFVRRIQTGRWNVVEMCGGILGGLVSITAGCGSVFPYSSIIIGAIGGLVYMGAVDVTMKFKVDDPVQAFPVHGACGMWGTFACALFDWGVPKGNYHAWGGFSPTDGAQLGGGILVQVVGILAISAWTAIMLTLVFMAMKKTGFLRVSSDLEDVGLDAAEFSPAKPYTTGVYGADSIVYSPKPTNMASAKVAPAPDAAEGQ